MLVNVPFDVRLLTFSTDARPPRACTYLSRISSSVGTSALALFCWNGSPLQGVAASDRIKLKISNMSLFNFVSHQVKRLNLLKKLSNSSLQSVQNQSLRLIIARR